MYAWKTTNFYTYIIVTLFFKICIAKSIFHIELYHILIEDKSIIYTETTTNSFSAPNIESPHIEFLLMQHLFGIYMI